MSKSNAHTLVTAPTTRNIIEVSLDANGTGANLHASSVLLALLGWVVSDQLASGTCNTQSVVDALAERGLIDTAPDLSLQDDGAKAWATVLNSTIKPVLSVSSFEEAEAVGERGQRVGYGIGAQQTGLSFQELADKLGYNPDREVKIADEAPTTGDPEVDAAIRELEQALGVTLH